MNPRDLSVTDLAGWRAGSITVEKKDLEAYAEFLRIDLRLAPSSVKGYVSTAREFLAFLNGRQLNAEVVREYLKGFLDSPSNTYANRLKGLRHYLRDWIGLKDLAEQFRFPEQTWFPTEAPKREKLKAFYAALPTLESRAAFLLWATTGKRRNEVLSLTRDRIEVENRLIVPAKKESQTKHEWYGVFNEECRKVMIEHISTLGTEDPLFSSKRVRSAFEEAKIATGIKITPQRLRDWFCQEMGELGVPDRFIDAFCGRTPKSVLARHYSDYSPERLKSIYDKAGLRILN